MNRYLFILFAGWGLLVQAESKVPDFGFGGDEAQRPILSATGKKRLQENVRTLEGNLKDMKENLVTSAKNLEIIKAELKDLENLEREHLDLKKRYETYLGKAGDELNKNEKARRDLAKWEASNKNIPKNALEGTLRDKLEAARLELADRERWSLDAQSKLSKVKQLVAGLDANLKDVRSRKKPLQDQLATWTTRHEQYQKDIADAEMKKGQWEKVLR